jgi:AcrR family transcriptional regulator
MSTTRTPRVGEQRPGGRATRVRNAVLVATAELLDEIGHEAMTYDEIASRAGVDKTTVYRRWPSKLELIADALDLHSEQQVPVPDTGTLAGDLTALAAAVTANITSPGGARRSTSMVAATAHSDELAETVHQFMSRRVALTAPIVERAIGRGELPADTDPRLVIEALVGPIWFRLLLTGEPIENAFLSALVTLVETGAHAARD